MLTQEEMRRNPAGAVDQFQRREGSPAIKRAILAWRRGRRALEPENTEPNFTSVEPYRRSLMPRGVSTFMADAQIPGSFAMSPQAKDNWPLGDPPTTALAQAQAREARELAAKERHRLRERQRSERRKAKRAAARAGSAMTPEQRQAVAERLAQAREAARLARDAAATGETQAARDLAVPA
jgi:hypothetical protein